MVPVMSPPVNEPKYSADLGAKVLMSAPQNNGTSMSPPGILSIVFIIFILHPLPFLIGNRAKEIEMFESLYVICYFYNDRPDHWNERVAYTKILQIFGHLPSPLNLSFPSNNSDACIQSLFISPASLHPPPGYDHSYNRTHGLPGTRPPPSNQTDLPSARSVYGTESQHSVFHQHGSAPY